jgi:hypothetical protein
MRNLFALLGLTKHALARVYMSRDERRRVRGRALNIPFATALRGAGSFAVSIAVSVASDVRAIGILCSIGLRNLVHDAKAACTKADTQD